MRHEIYIHLCGECKRSSMLLNLERCIFCDAENFFYLPGNPINDNLMGELMNDLLLLESSESADLGSLQIEAV